METSAQCQHFSKNVNTEKNINTQFNPFKVLNHLAPPNFKKNAVMQLLHDHQILMSAVKELSLNMTTTTMMKDAPSDSIVVKEKKSSDASLLQMNPVASGDNVATGLDSAHKIKEELPPLVPCCEGRELSINEDLVRSGLSAISVKHENSVIQCLSMSRASEKLQVPPGLIKHRNSFRSLHRPDIKRVPYLRRMTPTELETLFRGCPFRGHAKTEHQDESTRVFLPPYENIRSQNKETTRLDNGTAAGPHRPILETWSGAADVPAGMRLHGARARLYTSVLAGARAGDQSDAVQPNEEFDSRVPDVSLPEDEVQLNEELQIILPPRCDDVTADSSVTTTTEDSVTG